MGISKAGIFIIAMIGSLCSGGMVGYHWKRRSQWLWFWLGVLTLINVMNLFLQAVIHG